MDMKKVSEGAMADVYECETGDAVVLLKDGEIDRDSLMMAIDVLPEIGADSDSPGAFVIRNWADMPEGRKDRVLDCFTRVAGDDAGARELIGEPRYGVPLRDVLPRALDAAAAAEAEFRTLYDLSGSLWMSGAALTGLGSLDAALGGLQPGTVTVFAGHFMSGKDALVRQLAVNAAKDGSRVLLFPFGESAEEAATRILAAQARVNLRYLHSGALHAADWGALEDAAARLSALEMSICDDGAATVEDVAEMARRSFDGRACGLIALTGCELMRPSARGSQAERLACSLRALAQELNVPVAMTVEIPEGCITPDMRESSYEAAFELLGRLPDFAANVVLIDRPLDDEETERDPRAPMAFCARAVVQGTLPGETVEVDLAYVSEYLRFLNLEQDSDFR